MSDRSISDPVDLTPEDVSLIRLALRELPSATENMVGATHERPATAGSPAHRYFDRAAELHPESGVKLVQGALGGTQVTILAASDHMKALVSAFNNPLVSVATATLTRGVVEALGKAYHVLSADSAELLVQRYIALLRSEMEQAVKYNEFQTSTGDAVDGSAHLASQRSLLADMGLAEIGTVQLTVLATAVLDASGGGPQSRQIYSQLSSVAHAESAGVAMYLQITPQRRATLRRSRDIALDYVGTAARVYETVVDRAVHILQPDVAHVQQWEGAKKRSQDALDRLLANREPV